MLLRNAACLLLCLVDLHAGATNCLWKATSGDTTFYVQGSMHLLKPENYPLDPAIEAAYSNATAMVFEVDLRAMNSAEASRLMLKKAMLKPPKTLQDTLKPQTYDALKEAFTEAGSTVDTMKQAEPWFATMMLAVIKMQSMGLNPQLGLDHHFNQRAVRDGKCVIGLETIEFQVDLFDQFGESNPDDFVMHALDEMGLMGEEMPRLIKAWEDGDLDQIEELMSDAFRTYPELYESFVNQRNRDWVGKLKELTRDDEIYMVIVGAAHLPGEEGLIRLLEKSGFSLQQQ